MPSGPPASGRHPERPPLISPRPRGACICLAADRSSHGPLATSSSGAPRSSTRWRRPSRSSTAAARWPSSWWASRASARRACSPSSPARRRARAASSCRVAPPELERDLPFWVFVDALDDYVQGSTRAARRPGRGRARASSPTSSRRSARGGGAGAGLQDERYRTHRAVRELLERLAATSRSSSCSTTCTGPTPRRWSCSARCCGARRRRCCWRWPCGRASCPSGCRRPRARPPRRRLTRLELGALSPARRASCWAMPSTAPRAAALYAESGGNPFYLEQLARSAQPARPSAAARTAMSRAASRSRRGRRRAGGGAGAARPPRAARARGRGRRG